MSPRKMYLIIFYGVFIIGAIFIGTVSVFYNPFSICIIPLGFYVKHKHDTIKCTKCGRKLMKRPTQHVLPDKCAHCSFPVEQDFGQYKNSWL